MTTDDKSTDDKRTAWLAGIREMADFLEAHPDVPLPSEYQPVYLWVENPKAALKQAAVALGQADKIANTYYFGLERRFGPIVYVVKANREDICERVVTGKRTETYQVPPEGVELRTGDREVDVVEWVCPPSILAFGDEAVAS